MGLGSVAEINPMCQCPNPPFLASRGRDQQRAEQCEQGILASIPPLPLAGWVSEPQGCLAYRPFDNHKISQPQNLYRNTKMVREMLPLIQFDDGVHSQQTQS